MKRIVVAGSRGFDDYKYLKSKLDQITWNEGDVIISGGAKGADSLGERYAKEHSIRLEVYSADWDQYGKRAGYIRNKQMAEACTHGMVFWDGESKGASHMIDLLKEYERKFVVFLYNKEDK